MSIWWAAIASITALLSPCQEPGVDRRVEGLHAPVKHLRMARDLGHVGNIQPGTPERACGPASGEELPPPFHEHAPQLHDARLVSNAEKCPAWRAHVDRNAPWFRWVKTDPSRSSTDEKAS